MIGPASMCFCGHRFKEHEFLQPVNKKVQTILVQRYFANDLNALAQLLVTYLSLGQTISNVYVSTLTQNMIQFLRNVLKVNVVVTDFPLHGHAHVAVNLETIRRSLKQEKKEF